MNVVWNQANDAQGVLVQHLVWIKQKCRSNIGSAHGPNTLGTFLWYEVQIKVPSMNSSAQQLIIILSYMSASSFQFSGQTLEPFLTEPLSLCLDYSPFLLLQAKNSRVAGGPPNTRVRSHHSSTENLQMAPTSFSKSQHPWSGLHDPAPTKRSPSLLSPSFRPRQPLCSLLLPDTPASLLSRNLWSSDVPCLGPPFLISI